MSDDAPSVDGLDQDLAVSAWVAGLYDQEWTRVSVYDSDGSGTRSAWIRGASLALIDPMGRSADGSAFDVEVTTNAGAKFNVLVPNPYGTGR